MQHRIRAGTKPEPLNTTSDGEQPMWDAFDAEARDDAWAVEREQQVEQRVGELMTQVNQGAERTVTVRDVQCRARHCRMLVVGQDEARFRDILERMQDDRGFYGVAEQLSLDGYGTLVDKESGEVVHQVRVHLKFAR